MGVFALLIPQKPPSARATKMKFHIEIIRDDPASTRVVYLTTVYRAEALTRREF